MLPKAINGVVWRIGVFYVGPVLLLAMLLPWPFYSAGGVMNAVVLTAALSSVNSGLYSTGRILRSLAEKGEAPSFVSRMSRRQVPYGGILFTSVAYVLGVVLNYLVPKEAFDIAIASLGVISTWATLLFCQLRLRQAALRGELERPAYRMPWAPYSGWATLAFLALVVLMGFSDGAEKIAFSPIPVLAVGWRFVKRRERTPSGKREVDTRARTRNSRVPGRNSRD